MYIYIMFVLQYSKYSPNFSVPLRLPFLLKTNFPSDGGLAILSNGQL